MKIPLNVVRKGLTDNYVKLIEELEGLENEIYTFTIKCRYLNEQIFKYVSRKTFNQRLCPANVISDGLVSYADGEEMTVWKHANIIVELSKELVGISGKLTELINKRLSIESELEAMEQEI